MAGHPEQRVRGLLWRRSLEQTRESAGTQQAGQWSTYCVVLVSGVHTVWCWSVEYILCGAGQWSTYCVVLVSGVHTVWCWSVEYILCGAGQ